MVRMCACVSQPATRGDRAPRGVASACRGQREASGSGGEPSLHAVPSLMCDIGSHAWPCVRDGCALLHLAQSVGVYSERLRMLCVRCAQSVGVFSERLRLVCTRARRGTLRRGTLPAHERVLGVPHLVARRVCSRALATLGLHPWVWMSYTLGCGTVLAL